MIKFLSISQDTDRGGVVEPLWPQLHLGCDQGMVSVAFSAVKSSGAADAIDGDTCWIINLLLDVLLCSIVENFYSLFVF